MRLRIVRPLPAQLEGFDLTYYRFGAAYEITAPLSDVLLVSGYGIPEDEPSRPATTPKPPRGKRRESLS